MGLPVTTSTQLFPSMSLSVLTRKGLRVFIYGRFWRVVFTRLLLMSFSLLCYSFALQDTYFPAFKASVVEGGARGVMCS